MREHRRAVRADPVSHRLKRPLHLPRQLNSEAELKRHLVELLAKNETCEKNLNFLGAGCWQHHVPAVVDEIVGRAEFLTPVWGSAQSDHGRNQAWFEFQPIGRAPGHGGGAASGLQLGLRRGPRDPHGRAPDGRQEVLVPRLIDPERLSVIRNYASLGKCPAISRWWGSA